MGIERRYWQVEDDSLMLPALTQSDTPAGGAWWTTLSLPVVPFSLVVLKGFTLPRHRAAERQPMAQPTPG